MKLQPKKKSLSYYIRLWYEYASSMEFTEKEIEILNHIDLLDDAILIVDDIFDNSKLRNWKPCLYIEEWIQKALISAELCKVQAIEKVSELMNVVGTETDFQNKVYQKIFSFLQSIYLWESIDQQLSTSTQNHIEDIKKYNEMIILFTGWHISHWLDIWQLIANQETDGTINKIAEKAGNIRQIVDDFNDYFDWHHEPFGDFINQSNRLPEIIFKKHNWDREKVLELIWKQEYEQARSIILNDTIRTELYERCQTEYDTLQKIKTNFNIKLIVEEDFQTILTML